MAHQQPEEAILPGSYIMIFMAAVQNEACSLTVLTAANETGKHCASRTINIASQKAGDPCL